MVLSASLAMVMAGCGDDDPATTASGGGQTATTPALTATTVTTTTGSALAIVGTASSSLGTILVDAAGRALYTFDRDAGGTSACTGNCAATWPPLVLATGTAAPVAGTGVGSLGVAARPDDATKLQVVWNGKPLYTYAGDAAPGETKGDGVGGNWHVAKPA